MRRFLWRLLFFVLLIAAAWLAFEHFATTRSPAPRREPVRHSKTEAIPGYRTHCQEVYKTDRLRDRDKSNAVVEAPMPGTYKVHCVVDGDTFDIEFVQDGVRYKNRVRVLGLNTPETVDKRKGKRVQCFGYDASAEAKKLLVGATVRLEGDKTQYARDNFHRILAYVYLQNGELYNLHMIEQGFGHEDTVGRAYAKQAEFRAAERRAADEKRGMWHDAACATESAAKQK